jgi:hypothetical protein
MSGVPSSPTNLRRLKDKLKKDSLAIRLVEAQMTGPAGIRITRQPDSARSGSR